MKPQRRSTRSKKSNSLFSSTEWKLEDEHWTSESKRLIKLVQTSKKTCTQDVTAIPSDGKTRGQDLTKREILGAGYNSNTEGKSPIISDGKTVGYPSSTDSHSITEKAHSADGNCGNMNERNVAKEKTELKTTWTAESTNMIVEKRKKAKENGNIVKLKKAGKNKTDVDVNLNLATFKKMKRQNEDSNIIDIDDSLDDILNHEFSVNICPSLEEEKLKQRQESGPFVGENGAVTERTKRQCVPLTIQDSSGNTSKANNASLGPYTDNTSLLSNEYQVLLCQLNDEFLNNEAIKEEILDDDEVQILKITPKFQMMPMISVKTESGESNMRSRAGDMGSRASDMKNMPSTIPSFVPHSTDDFSFQPRQNVTIDRPRPSVIMETPRDTIRRDGPHDHGTIGMAVPHHSIDMDHDYAKIASRPTNVTGVGSASGRVDTPKRNLTTAAAEAREAVNSQEVAQFGLAREREHKAGLKVVGPSVGVDDQVADGGTDGSRSGVNRSVDNNAQVAGGCTDGSRWKGVSHSVGIQASAQGGNRGAMVYGGAGRGNDKMKIKVEIELSTAQFIEVAHVLPTLGSASNAE